MSVTDDVFQFPARINSLAWSPDSQSIAAACSDGAVYVCRVDMPSEVGPLRLHGHCGEALSVTWSPDGKRIASGGTDCRVQLWNAETGEKLGAALVFDNEVSKVQWAPIGHRFLVVSGRRVWVAKEEAPKPPRVHHGRGWAIRGEQTARLKLLALEHAYGVADAEFDPSGKFIATASANLTIEIWDAINEEWTLSLAEKTGVVRLKWAPDGLRVAAGTNQGFVYVYRAAEGRLMEEYYLANAPVKDLSWIQDRDAQQHKVVGVQGRQLPLSERQGIAALAFSPDGRYLATGNRDRAVHIYSQEELSMS